MTAKTYRDCYRTLHSTSDSSWKELRLAYRRRVRLCHPDLQGAADRDEEFKRVVHAYRAIARYHLRHGTLPPPHLRIDERHDVLRAGYQRAEADTVDTFVAPSDTVERSRWRPRAHVAVFAAFISGVGAAAIVETLDGQPPLAGSHEPSRGQLAVGMDPVSVIDIHGAPNHTSGSVWYYGDSGVIFDRGCVVGWENLEPFPLRTLTTRFYLPGSLLDRADDGKPEDCQLPDS